MAIDRPPAAQQRQQLRRFLPAAEERQEIRSQRLLRGSKTEDAHKRGIARDDAAVGANEEIAREILIHKTAVAFLAFAQSFLHAFPPRDVGINLQARRVRRRLLQRPMTRHMDGRAIPPHLLHLAFQCW